VEYVQKTIIVRIITFDHRKRNALCMLLLKITRVVRRTRSAKASSARLLTKNATILLNLLQQFP